LHEDISNIKNKGYMIQTVVKRDGRIVGFNEQKIMAAIRKAMLQTDKGEDEALAQKITDHITMRGKSQMTVEGIQDFVEKELMKSARKDVAQRYIAYRNQRSIARKAKTRDIFMEIVNIKNNDVTRENANMNADTPAGMMMKFSSETTKPFVDDYLLSRDVYEAVRQNYIHIHDKDYYPTKSLTCVQHPLDHILDDGFVAGHGSSRPAKRIETAAVLACISLETCQNEMHGGQAIPAFDFYLAPYVRTSYIEEVKNVERLMGLDLSHLYHAEMEDYTISELTDLKGDARWQQHAVNKTVNRVHQAMEAFIHNMNTIHSRGGNQVVFSSINYGTDTSAEGRCIIRELLKSTYEGVGNGETAIFPIQIWKKKRGVNLHEAFNQIHRYSKESFNTENSLYKYVQIFVISNGTYTRYFANTTAQNKNHYEFTCEWADAKNRVIRDLEDFTATFFEKRTILEVLTKYCVFDSNNTLLIMRPYQIAATERILWKIESSFQSRKAGKIEAGGFIWHTTGSGKTLTSFKTAKLATELDYIDKVFGNKN